jgi:hypothetical protein
MVGAVAAWLLALPIVANAQARDPSLIYSTVQPVGPGQYFIDFRARPSSYIGHTYIVYGYVGPDGRVAELHYAGLIPERDVWEGLFVPIEANVRQYVDDTKLLPSTVYRRRLSPDEYRRVKRLVQRLKATDHRWHAILRNCNSFAVTIADELHLARPPSLLPPSMWVGLLAKLNAP